MKTLTTGEMKQLYLSYVNDFLSLERMAEYYSMKTDQARSVVNRGKILFLSESGDHRLHFTSNCANLSRVHFHTMSENNRSHMCKRHTQKLISEHSA